MNRILFALTILGAGVTSFLAARQSAIRLEREANVTREAWQTQTQLVAFLQSEQANLTERVRELKQTLAHTPAVADSGFWSALQTHRADRLPRTVSERLMAELGINWQSSADYIVVTKQTVRDIGARMLSDGKLSDVAAAVLALTPEERGQLEAAAEQAQSDFKDWVLAHVQRAEPAEEVVARYTLPGDATLARSISNNFFAAAVQALGEGRTELIRESALAWMREMGVSERSTKLTIKRVTVGDEPRLNAEVREQGRDRSAYLPVDDSGFPKALRALFPNRWADLAAFEGFELPPLPEKE